MRRIIKTLTKIQKKKLLEKYIPSLQEREAEISRLADALVELNRDNTKLETENKVLKNIIYNIAIRKAD